MNYAGFLQLVSEMRVAQIGNLINSNEFEKRVDDIIEKELHQMLKVCRKCGFEKPLNDFYKNGSYRSYRHCYCKECTKAVAKKNFTWKRSLENMLNNYGESEIIRTQHNLLRIKSIENIIYHKKATRKWEKEHIQEHRQSRRKRELKAQLELTDSYVVSTLCHKSTLKRADIPKSLVDIKRAYLMAQREIKQINF